MLDTHAERRYNSSHKIYRSNLVRLFESGNIKVEYENLTSRLVVYKNGFYVGDADIIACVRHLIDESPDDDLRNAEFHSRQAS